MISLDLKWVRSQFPALTREINGKPIVFFDGPGGTQVPGSVIDAIADYLVRSNANAHGVFATSMETDAIVSAARSASADLLGCDAGEIVFGANMTTLTFALSRAIGRELIAGDEIVVTSLDHYANVSPWMALQEKGIVVRTVEMKLEDCTLDLEDLERQLNQRTRLIAVGYASNAVGTINDIAKIVAMARRVGALVFVDAVHYVPHGAIDVGAIDCDFLVCSAYKFFAPHIGILYGKREHLTRFRPYKVLPATDEVPFCWETGTQNYEALAGLIGAIGYLAKLGCHVSTVENQELLTAIIDSDGNRFNCHRVFGTLAQPTYLNRRAAIISAMEAIKEYECQLSEYLLARLSAFPQIKVYGIADFSRLAWRTPTVGISVAAIHPRKLAEELGKQGIFTWNGNFYALGVTERLGLESSGGLLRIGLVHYNTFEEIDRLLMVLQKQFNGQK
jgi:cysteine desulfurase family protein (TIGR01976 family)